MYYFHLINLSLYVFQFLFTHIYVVYPSKHFVREMLPKGKQMPVEVAPVCLRCNWPPAI